MITVYMVRLRGTDWYFGLLSDAENLATWCGMPIIEMQVRI